MAFDPALEIDFTGFIEFGTAYVAESVSVAFSAGVELPDPEIEFGTYYVNFGGAAAYAPSIELDDVEIEKANVFVDTPKHKTYTAGVEGLTPCAILWPGGDGVNIMPSVEIVWEWPEPIVAAFSADPERGVWPLTVVFTDESTGEITRWSWDFDDPYDPSSTVQNPTHMFRRAGTYTVTLRVYDQYGR